MTEATGKGILSEARESCQKQGKLVRKRGILSEARESCQKQGNLVRGKGIFKWEAFQNGEHARSG